MRAAAACAWSGTSLRGRAARARVPRARRRELRAAARRVARRHRRERRRQVDAAQDRRRRDPAHARHASPSAAASARCSSSDRASTPSTPGSPTSTSPPRCWASRRARSRPSATRSSRSPTSATHIHDPIKHYSSGMVVRLGFAVATTLTPDVLITDEVLAVGDESFQKKCVAWMENYLAGGGTLLLCSHSMYHVQKLCRSALWLKDGRVERYGAGGRGHAGLPRVPRGEERRGEAADRGSERGGGRRLRDPVARARARRQRSRRATTLAARRARSSRRTAARRSCWSASCAPTARRSTASRPTWTASRRARIAAGPLRVRADAAARSPLLPGKYFVRAHALDPEGVRLFDHVERAARRHRRRRAKWVWCGSRTGGVTTMPRRAATAHRDDAGRLRGARYAGMTDVR